VLEGLSGREKREYGDMLLRAVGVGGSYKNSAAFVTLHESKKLLKGRLEAIMTFKEKTKRDFTLSVLMTSLLAVSGAAVGAYAAPVSEKIEDIQVAESKQYDIRYVDSMKDVERVEYEMPQEEERMNWLSQYRQMCWWQDEYIFWIGWNVYEYYWGNCIGEEILLTDGSAMYVQFDEACNWVRADQDAMQALKTLLVRVRDQKEDSSYPLVYPIVVSGEYVGNVDAEQLADVYYMEDKKSEFAAIFPRLEKEKQENYLEQFYENEEINDLYLILKYMENNLIFQYVERAYENDETRIFSVKKNEKGFLLRLTFDDASISENLIWMSAGIFSIVGTMMIGIIVSKVMRPVFLVRYLYPVSVVAWVLLGVIISRVNGRGLYTVLILLYLLTTCLPEYSTRYIDEKNMNEKLSRTLEVTVDEMGQNDVILTDNSHIAWTIADYYYPEKTNKQIDLLDFPELEKGINYWLIIESWNNMDELYGMFQEEGYFYKTIIKDGNLGGHKVSVYYMRR